MIASCRLWSVFIPRPGVRFMFQHGRTSYFFLSLPRSFVLHSPFPPVPFNAASAPASVNSIIVYTYIVNNFCPAVFVPSLPVRFYFYGIGFSSVFCLPSIGIRPAGSVRSGFFFLLFIHGRGTYSLCFRRKHVSEHSIFFPGLPSSSCRRSSFRSLADFVPRPCVPFMAAQQKYHVSFPARYVYKSWFSFRRYSPKFILSAVGSPSRSVKCSAFFHMAARTSSSLTRK